MARVTGAEVKGILQTDLEDTALAPFINTAHLMVEEQLADKGMSEARLDQIELYLSAHFATLREQQLQSEKLGTAAAVYQGKTGMNLQATHYGQSALTLDTSNTLMVPLPTDAPICGGVVSLDLL